jgi:regulator of sirC expression with transglutaminase-like and TPR domain
MAEGSFQEEIGKPKVDLPVAALLFAKEIAYPNLDITQSLALLDGLTSWARQLIDLEKPLIIKIRTLSDFLFDRFGFRGNTADYEDPRNSYLNEVLDRRLGIPISLSVLFITLAQNVGIPAYGVGLPGHFVVGIRDPLGNLFVDAFNGGQMLTLSDCSRLVKMTTGYSGELRNEWLAPVNSLDLLARMLNNLRIIYINRGAWLKALAVIEHLRMIQPNEPQHLRDLGLVHQESGSLRLAIQYYEQYLTRVPNAPDAETIRGNLQITVQRLGRLN